MMTIGIAVVTTNLSLGGSTELAGNTDDFYVYISSVSKYNENDANIIINSDKSFSFTKTFFSLGELVSLDIFITNASKNYDASVTYDCDYDEEYIYLSSQIDSVIPARGEKIATLDVKLKKTYAGEDEVETTITCEILATAIERDELGANDVVSSPVVSSYNIGDEIAIGEEKFNIISQTDDTVSMLAQYGVNDELIQSSEDFPPPTFEGLGDWGTPSEYMDINIQNYDNEIKIYVNEYVDYISSLTGDSTISGDLISLKQLETLGCTVSEGYLTNYNETCTSSPYKDWLINNKWMWTKTVRIGFVNTLWLMSATGDLSPNDPLGWDMDINGFMYGYHIEDGNVVRPVITIAKATLAKYK